MLENKRQPSLTFAVVTDRDPAKSAGALHPVWKGEAPVAGARVNEVGRRWHRCVLMVGVSWPHGQHEIIVNVFGPDDQLVHGPLNTEHQFAQNRWFDHGSQVIEFAAPSAGVYRLSVELANGSNIQIPYVLDFK